MRFKKLTKPKAIISLLLTIAAISFLSFLAYKLLISHKTQPKPPLEVTQVDPSTTPEKFFIKNSSGQLVPYIINHQPNSKEVLQRAKNGIQKFTFKNDTNEVVLSLQKDGETAFHQVATAKSIFEYQKDSKWIEYSSQSKGGLTSRDQDTFTQIEGFYPLKDNATQKTLVELGFSGNKYTNKWDFELKDAQNRNNRLTWKITKDKSASWEDINLNADDFTGPVNESTKSNTKTYTFYPDGKRGDLKIDPTLSITTTSTTISVASNQTAVWCAVWDSSKGGTIDEFYLSSSCTGTNLAEDDVANQRNQDLFNITYGFSGTYATAVSDPSARLTLLEYSDTRIKIRAEGNLDRDASTNRDGWFRQDFTVYPDRIVSEGWVHNDTAATEFQHSFNFEPATFTNNGTATSVYIGDNDTAMAAFATGTTWRTATGVTYEAPGPVAVMQVDSSNTDITVFATDIPFEVAQDDLFYWENGASFDKFAWGGDAINVTVDQTVSFGSVMVISNDNTSTGSEGRNYARDFWNPTETTFATGSRWDETQPESSRFWNTFFYPVFSDGFETGDTSRWSSETDSGSNLTPSTASVYTGTYGSSLTVGATVAYVTDTTPSTTPSNPGRIRARFYVNPNSITMTANDEFTILADHATAGSENISVRFARNSGGTGYQTRACLENDAGTDECTALVNINNSYNYIEAEWGLINTSGYVRLWVNGAFGAEDNAVDAGTQNVDQFIFGNVVGRDAGTSGTIYLDDFKWTYDAYLGSSSFNQKEGTYGASASSLKSKFDIDGNSVTKYNPAFEISKWRETASNIDTVKIDGNPQTEGTNFNVAQKPISQAYFGQDITFYAPMESTTTLIGDSNLTANSITFTPGRYGNGAQFNSTTDTLDFTYTNNLSLAKGTLEFWLQPNTSSTSSTLYGLFSISDATDTNWMSLEHQADNDLGFIFQSGGATCNGGQCSLTVTSSNYSWSPGDWVHIRITWDDTNSTSTQQRLYINGSEPTHTDPASDYVSSDLTGMGTNARIGNWENGGGYNCDCIIDEFYVYNDDTSLTRLANGGNPADADEYLNDPTNNFTLSFADDDASNRGEYLYLGSDTKFSGINVKLATPGVGNNPNLDWDYWTGTTWASLESVSGFSDGTNNFTQSGSIYWNLDPTTWSPNSLNGSPDLYYIRAHLEDGSYTTSPIEDTILTDIVTMQYLGNISTAAQTIEVNAPPQTMLAWNFDEGNNASAYDSSGFGNTGTITGPTWQVSTNKDSLTKRSRYLQFDGSNDFVTRTNDTDFNFGTGSFTVSGWFRSPADVSGTDMIFSRATALNGVGYKIYMNSTENLCFGMDDVAGSFPSDSACTTLALNDAAWHYFAAVKSGTSSITLYVDGNQLAQDASIATGTLDGSATLYIGIDSDGTSNPFAGSIDHITVYDYALTAAQVKSDIPDPSSTLFGANATDPLANGLVGYWKMEEASDATRADSSGNGNTLTESASDTIVQTTGKFGYSADFESADTETLSNSTFSGLASGTSMTLATWINIESAPSCSSCASEIVNSDLVLGLSEAGSDDNVSAIELQYWNGSWQSIGTTSNALAISTWYHVALTYSAPNQTYSLYVNGVLQTSGTLAYTIGPVSTVTLGNTRNDYFDGLMDDTRIYSRALSAKEIEQLYNWAPGPIAWWKLDENIDNGCSGGTNDACDSSGNGVDGAFTGNPTWKPGKYGQAVGLDGVDDGISLGDVLDMDTNSMISVSMWIYPTSSSGDAHIFTKKLTAGGGDGGYMLYYWSSANGGNTCFYVSDGSGSGSDQYETCTADNSTSTTNRWYHIVATYDNASFANSNIYLNGANAEWTPYETCTNCGGTTPIFSEIDSPATVNGLCLGVGSQNTGACSNTAELTGIMDDVRVYNYALSSKQVAEIYNAGHPFPGSPIGSAVARWKLDDLSGTTAQDATDNNLDLTVTASSWTSSGKFGGAFDGATNRRMSISNTSSLEPASSEDFTISMWVKSDGATTAATEYLAHMYTATEAGYRLSFNTSGQVVCEIDDDGTSFPEDTATGTTDAYDTTWHHIACVRDINQDKLFVYVDGRLDGQDTDLSATGAIAGTQTHYFGDANNTDGTDEFLGDFDEIKFYRAALSPSELLADMNLGSTASLGSVTDQSEQGFSISDPVAYYKMDENVGTSSTADTAAGLNNGTMSNFVATDWRIGKFGSALNFNATTSSINAGSATGIDNLPASGMAISAWIYPNSQGEGSAGFIVAKNAGTTPSAGWILQIAGTNALTFTVDGSTDLVRTTSNSVLTTGAWNHVVVSWDGVITTASSVNIYVNGSVVTYATTTNGASRVADGASSMYIGNDSSGARTFDGLIDELKIFSGTLTLPQVEYLYNGGQPTVWYKLDECTGNTAYNSAVNANNVASGNNGTIYPVSSGNTTVGTCSSGVTTDMWNDGTTGKFNSALGFDGIDDYVDLGDLTFTESASQLTWSFWVKGNTWDTSTVLLAKSDLAGTQIGWSFAVSTIASHRLVITIPTTVTDGTTSGYLDNIFTDTSWIHITAVFDGTLSGNDNRLKVFINGKQVALQFSGTIPATTTATTSNAVIGGISGGTNYSLDGLIDDVRIYNYALSTSQVQKAYNQGASVRFGPETGNP